MKNAFINAIQSKKKVRLTFYSKEDGAPLSRLCAPMDFGPSSRAHDKSDRLHLWDYQSDKAQHVLSLLPEQVIKLDVLEDFFDPAGFVTWKPKWFIARDWGVYS